MTDDDAPARIVKLDPRAAEKLATMSDSDQVLVKAAIAQMQRSSSTGDEPSLKGSPSMMIHQVTEEIRLLYSEGGRRPGDELPRYTISAVVTPEPGQLWNHTTRALNG